MIEQAQDIVFEPCAVSSLRSRGVLSHRYTKAVRSRRGAGGIFREPFQMSVQDGVGILCKGYRAVFYEILEAAWRCAPDSVIMKLSF